MNAFDLVLIVVLVAGGLIGLTRGATRIVIGIVSLFVAFILASRYQDSIASVLVARHVAQGPARVAAYILIFLLTMVAGGLVAWIVGKMLKIAMLSWADRLAGAALGLAGAMITAAFLVHPLAASTPSGSRLLAESKLAPYVSVVADLCNAIAPDAVARRYNQGIDTVRKIWRGEAKLPDLDAVKKGLTGAVEAGEKAIQNPKKPPDKKTAPAQ